MVTTLTSRLHLQHRNTSITILLDGQKNMSSTHKQTHPKIGMKEPPPTEELMRGPSRFAMKPKMSCKLPESITLPAF